VQNIKPVEQAQSPEFKPHYHQKQKGKRERVREGGRKEGGKGGMEGGRKEGRKELSNNLRQRKIDILTIQIQILNLTRSVCTRMFASMMC
jgi:hypothetical protein